MEIIEQSGASLGEHPNCALVKLDCCGRHVEINGISIGGGAIKIKYTRGWCVHINESWLAYFSSRGRCEYIYDQSYN